MGYVVATFGEAEKGTSPPAGLCYTLADLVETFGNPPQESLGLQFAIQALLYERAILFFRVQEEGFSVHDYLAGLRYLNNQTSFTHVSALCLPGVGDSQIIHASSQFCHQHNSLLIMTEADLYDYLTSIQEG